MFQDGEAVDEDRAKGTLNETGHLKRKIGEWTGDKDAEIEGRVQEVEETQPIHGGKNHRRAAGAEAAESFSRQSNEIFPVRIKYPESSMLSGETHRCQHPGCWFKGYGALRATITCPCASSFSQACDYNPHRVTS